MLSRYTIYRRRPRGAPPLPDGVRRDTRHRTQHPLRPTQEMVDTYLADPTDAAWERFREQYSALIGERFQEDRAPFDELAKQAVNEDVYLGCSCPTQKNPIHGRCHTYLALEFMAAAYPEIEVVMPG